jgi:UDP-GlcNAc:undecaprenyl-phosphate GlcNAc-1-phosphate transferase
MTLDAFYLHLAFALGLFGAAVLATRIVLRFGVLDEPNHRSSHERPTPSGGGIAIVASFAAGFAAVLAVSDEARLSAFHLVGFGAAAVAIAAVGYVDDLKLLKTFKVKLAAQVGAALLLTLFGIVVTRISVPGIGAVDLGWAGYPLTILWVVTLTNVFNFMDGLDGLAGGTAVIVASFLCAVTFLEGSFFVYILCYVIAASAAGFLIFNFPPARLFMGDVGSQFLGFAFAALAVVAAEVDASRMSLLVVPLLFFHFLFDVFFTLVRRALRGENITQAHRSHLYQLLNRSGTSHRAVTLLHYGVTAAQGGGALYLLQAGPDRRIAVFLPFLVWEIGYAAVVMRRARKAGLLESPAG